MEESRPVSLRVGADIDIGLVRKENQDRINRILSPFGDVFIVADGMGGHEGGGTAAQMLIDGFGENLKALPAGTSPDAALQEAAARTNAAIYRQAQAGDPRFAKMGATCVLALIAGNRAWIAHAGDSRAYLWRSGRLERLTRDHTAVQRMIDRQILNEEEARSHPDANVVTRAFGQKPEIDLEVSPPRELFDGDRLLLCSDGLSGYVEDEAIAQTLAAGGDAQAAAKALIALALAAGGEDNVSVQLLAVQGGGAPPREAAAPVSLPLPSPSDEEEEPAPRPRRAPWGLLLTLVLVVAAFLAGVFLPWREWIQRSPDSEEIEETTSTGVEVNNPQGATDPVAESVTPGLEAGPGLTTDPPGTDLLHDQEDVEEEVAAAKDLLMGPPAPATSFELLVLGGDDKIRKALASFRKIEAQPAGEGFKEGTVYFREGYGKQAGSVLSKLNAGPGPDYAKQPWPKMYVGQHSTADVLVVARTKAAGPPPAPEAPADTATSPQQPPKVLVLLPDGAVLSEAERAALAALAGKAPPQENLTRTQAEALKEGTVYFRREFSAQGEDLASRLGYSTSLWPDDVAQAGSDILVIARKPQSEPVAQPEPGEKPPGTERMRP